MQASGMDDVVIAKRNKGLNCRFQIVTGIKLTFLLCPKRHKGLNLTFQNCQEPISIHKENVFRKRKP